MTPLAATADDIPDGVDEALKKALERDPAKRTATAKRARAGDRGGVHRRRGSHEEVGRVVEELAKKALDGDASAADRGRCDQGQRRDQRAPRAASFPTLDDSWVEQVDVPSTLAARAPPPPKPSP